MEQLTLTSMLGLSKTYKRSSQQPLQSVLDYHEPPTEVVGLIKMYMNSLNVRFTGENFATK